MFPWVIVIALLVAAAVLVMRTRMAGSGFISSSSMSHMMRQPPRTAHKPAVERKDFRAVSIKCGPGSCRSRSRPAGRSPRVRAIAPGRLARRHAPPCAV